MTTTNQMTATEFAKSHPTDADWIAAMGDRKITSWKRGDKVTANGYVGTIYGHGHNGMFEVRLPGGHVCVPYNDIESA